MVCSCYECPKRCAGEDDVQVLVVDLGDAKCKPQNELSQCDPPGNTSKSYFGSLRPPRTPRQLLLRDWLELPPLEICPMPPNSGPDDPPEVRTRKLREMYKEFAINLHAGVYMTLLRSASEYSDTHCQLMDDMMTLKLDQRNGRIVEFPLRYATKVYQVTKLGDEWCKDSFSEDDTWSPDSEEVVVIEFLQRKPFNLAFRFLQMYTAQQFQICMGLLVRRAKQNGPCNGRTLHDNPENEVALLDWALQRHISQPPAVMPCSSCYGNMPKNCNV